MRILEREYDIDVSKVNGYEKLEEGLAQGIDNCKLTRFIVLLDETRYMINADGNPEMTQEAQVEYDDYVSKIRQMLMLDEIEILDEGYGDGEDELEWHITGYFKRKESDDILGIIEIDTCVRTEEDEE